MSAVLITGGNRGLGLGLIREYLDQPDPPRRIFAVCRDLKEAKDLSRLAELNRSVHIFEADLVNFDCYKDLINQVDEINNGMGLNVLINNAGIGQTDSIFYGKDLEQNLLQSFKINTMAPILLSQAFFPLLKKGAEYFACNEVGVNRAAIINIGSLAGSIQSNKRGGRYPYRTSKAALNAATKSLAIDLAFHKILCVCIHPGWVRTEMGGNRASMSVEMSSRKILETIKSFNESHNGGFYRYDGLKLPW